MKMDPEYVKWELPYIEGLQYLHCNLLFEGNSVFYVVNKNELAQELDSKLQGEGITCAYE